VPASSTAPVPPRSGKPVMDLDSVFVPRSGPMPLHGAVVYKLTKGKWLRSDNWAGPVDRRRRRAAGDRVHRRQGHVGDVQPRRRRALRLRRRVRLRAVELRPGQRRQPGRDALSNWRRRRAALRPGRHRRDAAEQGGAGRFFDGLLREGRAVAADPRESLSGWTNEVVLEDIDAAEGSAEMALFRIDYCRRATLRNIRGSDTDANSAVRADGSLAVKNAVLRIHHVEQATVENCTFTGDVNLGAYDTRPRRRR
jgi:hypothetical protein